MNRDNKKISIVIPHFERANFLIETLKSIQDQTYKDWECIIVDDGSEEGTLNIIREFIKSDNRIRLNDRPLSMVKGANSCRRYGLNLATGKYIKWFDSDDIMKPSLLEEQFSVINRGGFNGVLCNCHIYNKDFSELVKDSWRPLNFSEAFLRDYLNDQLAWQTGAGLWEVSVFKDFTPFQYNINNSQEWLFHFEMLTRGINIGVIDKPLFNFRSHPNSISSNKKGKYFYHRLKARLIALDIYPEISGQERKALKRDIIITWNRNTKIYKIISITNIALSFIDNTIRRLYHDKIELSRLTLV